MKELQKKITKLPNEVLVGVPEAKKKVLLGIGRKGHHSPKQLKDECDFYFDYNKGNANQTTPAGLMLSLGITRHMWGVYRQKPSLAAICEEAMLKMEHLGTLRLYNRGNPGDIFFLKNMGWADKKEVETKIIELIGENLTNEQEQRILSRAIKRLGEDSKRKRAS